MTSEASTAAHPGVATGELADASAADQEAAASVAAAGQAARAAAGQLRQMPADGLDETLRAIAARLGERSAEVAAANSRDVQAARAEGLASAFVDRLTLDPGRIAAMADQLRALAEVGAEQARVRVRDLHDGLELQEWRRPVGVIGANFEARPNVVVDIASQLIKSRNAGVLRTGSSAIGSAGVLIDEVVGPAMASTGLDPAAIQLLRVARPPDRVRAGARARPDTAGHPARQRREHQGAGPRGRAARGADAGPRRRRRGDLPRLVGRPEAGPAADRDQPGPPRRLQPAEPAARPRGDLGSHGPAGDRAGGTDRRRRFAAAAPASARPRVGAGGRLRGHDHRGPGRRGDGRGRHRQHRDVRTGRRRRGRGCRRGRPVPGRLRRHRRVLERLPGCWTGSSCSRCRRRASTSMPCPGRAGR